MYATLVPSLAGLRLEPAPRAAPTGMDEDAHNEWLYDRYQEQLALREEAEAAGYSSVEEYAEAQMAAQQAAAPAPSAGVVDMDDDEVERVMGPPAPPEPAPGAPGPSNWLAQLSEQKQAEIKRKAEDAVAAATEAKRLKAEAKAAARQAAKEANQAERAAEKAAAAQARAEAKAAAKAQADAAKAAERAAAAQAKADAKAEADAAKAAAAALVAAEREEAAQAKAEVDAADEAEAAAQGITVKSLRAKRRRQLEAAKAEGYGTYEEMVAAHEAEKREAEAAAAEAERAAQEAAQAKADAEAAEAARKEKEAACEELEEQIHRLRWQQRTMAEDYDKMLQEWKDNNCDDQFERSIPKWMLEIKEIYDKLSQAIEDAEKTSPITWQIDDGDGGPGEHSSYVERFEQEAEQEGEGGEEEEEGEGEGEGLDVKGEAMRALAETKGVEDEAMDVDDDTLQIDLRIIVQNVRDDSEEKEKWRTQVIHTDYDNLPLSGGTYVTMPDPQPGNPNATKLVRTVKDPTPYPSDIPAAYIASIHEETRAIVAATKGMIAAILGQSATPASLLDSVAASPMTAYDATNTVTQQNLGFIKGKGMLLTQYSVTMQLPANDEANRDKAGTLIEGMVTTSTDVWSDMTGLRVKMVSGVQDKDSYMMGMLRMQKAKRDDPPNAEEKKFLAEKFGPDWYKAEGGVRPDDLMDALEWFRKMMKDMDQQERIEKMVAEQRKVGEEHAEAVREADRAGPSGA